MPDLTHEPACSACSKMHMRQSKFANYEQCHMCSQPYHTERHAAMHVCAVKCIMLCLVSTFTMRFRQWNIWRVDCSSAEANNE